MLDTMRRFEGGMELPAQGRTLRWNLLRWTSPATPRKGRISLSRPPDFVVTRTKQMVCDAFARAEAEERRDQPGN
ncbi:unnamed protein product, partial [Ascophyllum nodosum]